MDEGLIVLLDQNIPLEIADWLRSKRPSWTIHHVLRVGLEGKDDPDVFEWAQVNRALIITFDEDFADQRTFPVGHHHGIIRLRVWPTTVEEAQSGLERLLAEAGDEELKGALIIIDRLRIRIRRPGLRSV